MASTHIASAGWSQDAHGPWYLDNGTITDVFVVNFDTHVVSDVAPGPEPKRLGYRAHHAPRRTSDSIVSCRGSDASRASDPQTGLSKSMRVTTRAIPASYRIVGCPAVEVSDRLHRDVVRVSCEGSDVGWVAGQYDAARFCEGDDDRVDS